MDAKNIVLILIVYLHAVHGDDFKEEIFIKPLPPSHLYVNFQFITTVKEDSFSFKHSYLSPRSLGEIVDRFEVEELHLTLTEGQWRHQQWGYPVLDAAPGAELYAWFSPFVSDVDSQWMKLTATLSGLFCASLNFIDNSNTVTPQKALWPTGAVLLNDNSTLLRYSSLPREIVCTENLTPWKKLLPCDDSHGLASLLNSRMIHNTNYHSIGVHVRRVCTSTDCATTNLEIKQTVALVYDYRIINGNDWSFRKLFGQGLPGACPLSSSSKIYVDITTNSSQIFKLTPSPHKTLTSQRGGAETVLAIYDIKSMDPKTMINIGVKYEGREKFSVPVPPPLHFNRYLQGYGKEYGGIVTEMVNNHWTHIDVIMLENAPWWLPIQLSSLRVNGEADSKLLMAKYYSPGRSRQKPYHLELCLRLPARSITKITVDFEFVFLKWQEYPPDANHGFYIGSALITANLPIARNYTGIPVTGTTFDSIINASQPWYPAVFRTNGAMVTLPTPDFSMPYNVICLACTVVALAFGPLHNICTKDLTLQPMTRRFTRLQKFLRLIKLKRD